MKSKPKIVCICGSTRFIDTMMVEAWALEKQRIIVLAPHWLPTSYPGVQEHHQAEAEGVANVLDELHLRKIDLADEVLVVNVNGYIGLGTAAEIAYAKAQGKPVRYLEPPNETALPFPPCCCLVKPKIGAGEWTIECPKCASGIFRAETLRELAEKWQRYLESKRTQDESR